MPGLSRGTGRALFSNAPIPMRFPGLSFWLDAADINSFLLSGNNVSRWNDKSGNGRHFVTGTSPVINTTHLNGLDVVTFNGSNQFLQWSGSIEIRTVCAVLRINSTAINKTWLGIDRSDAVAVAALYLQYGNPTRVPGHARSTAAETSGATDYAAVGSAVSNNTWHRWQSSQDDRAATRWVALIINNGARVTDTTTSNLRPRAALTTLGAGQYNGSRTDYWPGEIAEVIVYDQPLGAGDLAAIDGYLVRKWGF